MNRSPHPSFSHRCRKLVSRMAVSLAFLALPLLGASRPAATFQNPIMFVAQVPVPADFTTIGSVFGNQLGDVDSVTRGGDLYIYYPDGTLKNLTATAGYGSTEFQGANSIAVRDPSVHWSGLKALFSMVVGAPTQQYQVSEYRWQMYEITGLGENETPVITKVPNQPDNFNNVSPIYGTDDRIIFTTDRPRTGEMHLYPQRDEYEEAPTVTGLWSLNPQTGDLFMINHTPSGAFTPFIDSFGRVLFTRWDHLQRDQQADTDVQEGNPYGTFNYSDESANATILNTKAEVFPEPRGDRTDLLAGTNLAGNSFNQFFPWQINEDGTSEETLNHSGRHDFYGYFSLSFTDDPALDYFAPPDSRLNKTNIQNFLQIKEDPTHPGQYFATEAPEFSTHASGRIVTVNAPPTINADLMVASSVTDPSTASYVLDDETPSSGDTGHYRDSLPLSGGELIASHTDEKRLERNEGTTEAPVSRYDFRLKTLKKVGAYWVADAPITPGISKSINWWTPDVKASFSGNLWELQPVEVKSRPIPARRVDPLPSPESQIFAEEGVEESALQTYLRQNDLAMIVSRNLTTRDHADREQPYNLRVAGSLTQTVGGPGKIYDIAFLQLFQADQIRGMGLTAPDSEPRPGRRVLAQVMHDPKVQNPALANAPAGSVKLGSDGSMAAFVPARRAMTWHLTDPAGNSVVKERYWLTFQPGEVRVCTSCHGINTTDQAGQLTPTNKPEALRELLKFWKAANGSTPANGTVGFTNSSSTVSRSAGSATINVSRTVSGTGAVSVNYATSDGSATAGTEYTATSGTLSWADSDMTPKAIIVPISANAVFDGSRTVNLALTNPTGGAALGVAAATLTITSSGSPPLPGDLNGDGTVGAADVNLLFRIFLGIKAPTAAELAAGDVRPNPGVGGRLIGDGQITSADLDWEMRRFVGLVNAP